MKEEKHIIKKQIIELNLSSQEGAFELQNEVSRIYHQKIISLIDIFLNQFNISDTIYQIDTLELNLENIDINHLEEELIAKIQQELAKVINISTSHFSAHTQNNHDASETSILMSKLKDQTDSEISSDKDKIDIIEITDQEALQIDIFSYFIENGILPWWSEKLTKQALEECCCNQITNSPHKIKYLLEKYFQDTKQLQRIIYQFSDATLLKIANLFNPNLVELIADYDAATKVIFKQLKQTKNISETKLRLDKWQGIFIMLCSSNYFNNSNQSQLIQENILYISISNGINYDEFMKSILAQRDNITQKEINFKTTFTKILQQLSPSSQDRKFSQEYQQAKLLLKELQELSQNRQAPPRNIQKINQIRDEITLLMNEIQNPDLVKNKLEQITQLNKISQITQTLKVNILEDPNYNQPIFKNTVNTFSDCDEIYIDNAGLVLLWPFMNAFLSKIALVKDNCFVNMTSRKKAILLLQYLVDGSIEFPEHILPLNKILCGLDLLEPIHTNLDITEQEQLESENLLSAVIQNWSILKNTSIEGLRKAFLQRKGVIKVRDGDWLLQVERESYDVLLDKIPWSIGVVKLPWMNNILYVFFCS